MASNMTGGTAAATTAGTRMSNQQDDLVRQLQARARGTVPSSAEQMLRQQTDRTTQGAAAMMGSVRGMNPALAAMQASRAQAEAQAQANQQSAILRAQEQAQAESMLGQYLQGLAGQQLQRDQMGIQRELGMAGIAEQRASREQQALQWQEQLAAMEEAQRRQFWQQMLGGGLGGLGEILTLYATGGASALPGLTGAGGGGANTGGTPMSTNKAPIGGL